MHLKSPLTKSQKVKAVELRSKPKAEEQKVTRRIFPLEVKPVIVQRRFTRAGTLHIPSKESDSPADSCSVKNDVPDDVRLKYRNQLAPLYNKGPYMLITSPEMAKDIGKKTSELE